MNEIRIQTGNLQRIRIGKWQAQTIRVVFDFDQIGKYNRFYLTSPFRIVFDIYRRAEFVSHGQQEREQAQVQEIPAREGSPSIARQLGLGVHRIVIDPGHGGKDPGTVNRLLGMQEKDITLDIGKRLNAILNEHSEFEIILTRPRDEYRSPGGAGGHRQLQPGRHLRLHPHQLGAAAVRPRAWNPTT